MEEKLNTLNTKAYHDIQRRKFALQRLYNAIKAHEDALLNAFRIDLGKSKFEAYTTEIGFIKKEISSTLKNMEKWLREERVSTPLYLLGNKSRILKDPLGKVLIISSFNYPFQLLMGPLIGVIAGGNVVAIKASEFVPNINKVIQDIITSSFSEDHVVMFEGDKDVASRLLENKFDLIFFTGSEKVGRIVYKKAAENLTPVVLELGGKSPAIVYDDANLDVIVRRIVWGKFMNAGQTCIAPDYVLVEDSIQDVFIEKAKEVLSKMYPTSEYFGKIVTKEHTDRLCKLLEDSNIEYRLTEERLLHPIITKINDLDSPLMKEEIFGPILPVLSFKERPEDIININPTPLAMYVFSEDIQKAKMLIKNTKSGGAMINNTILHLSNPKLPFGGVGTSGIGKYHGQYSIDTFTHQRSLMISSTKIEHSLLYPPFKNKLQIMKKILK